MEIDHSIFIGVILSIVAFSFKTIILQLIHRFFTGLSQTQVRGLFALFIVFLLLTPTFFMDYSVQNFQDKKVIEGVIETNSEKNLEEELIRKGVWIIEEIAETQSEKKNIRDSIRIANRVERWVYQIGLPSERKNEAIYELYKGLKGLGNIYAFEKDRNQYILFKDDGLSELQLIDSLASFQNLIGNRVARIEVVNLMDFCKLKHDMVRTKPISWRKVDEEIPCFRCD